MAIEKNAKEAVEAEFADELKNGTLVFRTIDISEPKNEAIAEKYEVTLCPTFVCREHSEQWGKYQNRSQPFRS